MSCGNIGSLRSRSRSHRRLKMSVNICPDDIFWITKLLLPNLVWWCCRMSQSVTRNKNCFTIFNVKVTAMVYIIIMWLFLLYLLNCWSVCNQTCCNRTTSEVGVPCVKIGLLRSMSRSQRRFKILVNVCPDNIFWTTKHFVTKPGMVMQLHKPKCHAEKLVHLDQCQGHSKGLYT